MIIIEDDMMILADDLIMVVQNNMMSFGSHWLQYCISFKAVAE